MGIQLNGSSGADIISSSDGTITINGTSTVTNPIVTDTITISDKISHTGDSNTHIRFAGDDTLTVETAGSERLRIASDGKVHFGNQTAVGANGYILKETSGDYSFNIFASSSTTTNRNITFNSRSNVEAMRINSTGNVSIGGLDPAPSTTGYNKATLHIMQTNSGASVGCQLKFSIADLGHTASDGGFISYWGDKNFYYNNRENLGEHRFYAKNAGGSSIAALEITNDTIKVGVSTTRLTGITQTVRNSGVSTATGSIIYNSTINALEVYTGSTWNVIKTHSVSFNVNYLVVGGGGAGGGFYRGGGGGAGALRTNWNNENQGGGQSSAAAKTIITGIAYSIILGAKGTGNSGTQGSSGGTSTFDDIVSKGGGGGGRYHSTSGNEDGGSSADPGGGSGGGGGGAQDNANMGQGGASGTYGYDGGDGSPGTTTQCGGGGGGAAAVGQNGGGGGTDGDGGAALANTITGSSVDYAGGAGGGNYGGGNNTIGGGAGAPAGAVGSAGAPGINATIANRGSGGSGAGGANVSGGDGSDGVVVIRFPSDYTATLTGGVTSSSATVGGDTVITITATSDTSQTVIFS